MAEQTPLQTPKKKRKWIRWVILALLVLAGILYIMLRAANGQTGTTINYLPARAERRDMTVTVTGPGTVKPNDTFRATALVKGEVLTAPFEEGQQVKKDDVLFTIDASDVESAIKQAKTGVEQAQASVESAQAGVNQALAGVEQANLSVESAQLNYDSLLRSREDGTADRQIKANAAGVISHLYVDPGDTVMTGSPVADILDRDKMKLEVPFHSMDANRFYVGETAAVTVTGTVETLAGTITEISAVDTVGTGGTLLRMVTITAANPGAISTTSTGTALVEGAASAAAGSFTYAASKQVTAKYSGKVETLTVREGDRVADGQLLGTIEEPSSIQDQIDAARIQLENAKLSRQNADTAVQNARLSLRNAELALRNAQDSLERTEDTLKDYTIKSTIDGTVIEKNYKAGDNVDPSALSVSGGSAYLAVIYDMSRLTFTMSIDELDVSKVRVGQKVNITADALESMAFTGTVDKVNINGTTLNGKTTYPVTVLVDGDGTALAGDGLWPGMNVSASIVVEEVGTVLTIPVDAVSRGNVVLVALDGALDQNGNPDLSKTEEREVVLGRNDEEYIEVLSGLNEGDVVLIQSTATSLMQQMMTIRG